MNSFFDNFAASRTGAMAAFVSNRRVRRVLPFATQVGLLIGGAFTVGLGAASTLASGLGPGPFDVLISGIGFQTGLPFAVSLWLLVGALSVVAAMLGNRPGIGTAIAPLIIGPTIGISVGILRSTLGLTLVSGSANNGLWATLGENPTEVLLAVSLHLMGVAVIGIGAGALITSGLGAGTSDLLSAAMSSKLGRSIPMVRTCFEVSWISLGVLMGGQFGFGTVLVALTIGPAVRSGHRVVEHLVTVLFGRTPLFGLRAG